MRLPEQLLYGDAIEEIPNLRPLIADVLDFDSTALLYGPSGAGKSFVALDWALSVASGIPWDDHEVEQGPVLYVLGEGLSGTRTRYTAWKKHHRVDGDIDIVWAPRAPNLRDPLAADELKEVVLAVNPTLTLLDTVARHIPGGDENSFETMSVVVETLDWIRSETGGCALGIHHSGKNEGAGARGHSSLKGAMDTEILCVKGPSLTVTKQKNHEDGHLLGVFKLQPVAESMVLVHKDRRGEENNALLVKALHSLGGVSAYAEWKALAVSLGCPEGSFDRTHRRLREAMVIDERIVSATGEKVHFLVGGSDG